MIAPAVANSQDLPFQLKKRRKNPDIHFEKKGTATHVLEALATHGDRMQAEIEPL